MKVAIVHEWLVTYVGSERVLEAIIDCFPEADLYAVADFLPEGERGFLHDKPVRTTFIQRMPFARRAYRNYLPLMPLAIEQLDLSAYDVVISSSHAVAKGVLTGPDQLHVSYVHSPARYAWDLQHQYLSEAGLERGPRSWITRLFLHKFRLWDTRTGLGVDAFIANSRFIARRIKKTYGRDATVIHPPVDTDAFALRREKDDFYLTVARMVPYKKVPSIVNAFSRMPDRRLIVIGDGPEWRRVQEQATPNVTMLGKQPAEVVRKYMAAAKAFVFMAEEDFGIVLGEAQACGTPVIAYRRGGASEIVLPGKTGILFDEQTADALIEAVEAFESRPGGMDPDRIRQNAERLSAARFRNEFSEFVHKAWWTFQKATR